MQHDPQRLWGCERCPRSHIRLGEVSEPVVRLLASRPRNGTESCSKHKPAGFLVHVGGVHARELSGEVNGGRAGAFLPGFLSCLRELAQGQTPAIRSLQSPLGAPPAPWDTPPPRPDQDQPGLSVRRLSPASAPWTTGAREPGRGCRRGRQSDPVRQAREPRVLRAERETWGSRAKRRPLWVPVHESRTGGRWQHRRKPASRRKSSVCRTKPSGLLGGKCVNVPGAASTKIKTLMASSVVIVAHGREEGWAHWPQPPPPPAVPGVAGSVRNSARDRGS